MSDEDPKRKLPVVQRPKLPTTTKDPQAIVARPQGIFSATFTGLQARVTAGSYRDRADQANAQAQAVESGINLVRTLGRAYDLPNTLAEDQAQRDEDRAIAQHQREEAAWRRMRDAAARDKDDEISRLRKEAELSQARSDTIYHARRAEAAEVTKDFYVNGTRHKVGTETVMREIKHLTAQQAIERRRAERSATSPVALDPNLVALLDEEIDDARHKGEPAIVLQRLTELKVQAIDPENLMRAVGAALVSAADRGDPVEVVTRLASIHSAFQP